MIKLSEKKKETYSFIIMVFLIAGVTGLPYLLYGITGWLPDLMYHLLRIEAVKEALQAGDFLPKIYFLFFGGYGYGSPLFYPDLFLVYPAFLRMLGVSPMATWVIFALTITVAATCTTYFSFRYICKKWKFAIAGTFLLMLSQFYLADLIRRLGISEYLAFLFMPVLFAGIYDFFVYDGKKMYLMGIAFAGLVLSHTNMTLLGILVTVLFFVIAAFFPDFRKRIFSWKRLGKLGVTALITVLSVSYYIFPMIEQMLSGEFLYMTPWAYVGNNTQPFDVLFNFTGTFNVIAFVGVGIPILMLFSGRFLYGRPKNRWADIFFFSGIALFLITTDIFPWKWFNGTFLNMIQFTYRLYPYALCAIVLGMILLLQEKCQESPNKIVFFIVVISLFFAFCQNYYLPVGEHKQSVDEQYLYENSNHVSMGEWLPANCSSEVKKMEAGGRVQAPYGETEFVKEGYNDYSFIMNGEEYAAYEVPLIYYKGYRAVLLLESGEQIELPVSLSENGLVQVLNNSQSAGRVEVYYGGTIIQAVSNIISILTVAGVIVGAVYKIYRQKKRKECVDKAV